MPDEADDREGLESQPSVLSTLDPMFKQNDGLGIEQTIHLHHWWLELAAGLHHLNVYVTQF